MIWEEQAKLIEWMRPWSKLLEWELPYAKWYSDGTLNACHNCVDRHPQNDTAIVWENELGETAKWSYGRLLEEIYFFAAELKKDQMFLYALSQGLIPRRFDCTCKLSPANRTRSFMTRAKKLQKCTSLPAASQDSQ